MFNRNELLEQDLLSLFKQREMHVRDERDFGIALDDQTSKLDNGRIVIYCLTGIA